MDYIHMIHTKMGRQCGIYSHYTRKMHQIYWKDEKFYLDLPGVKNVTIYNLTKKSCCSGT